MDIWVFSNYISQPISQKLSESIKTLSNNFGDISPNNQITTSPFYKTFEVIWIVPNE